jgi:hypothetical protein
LELPLKQHVRGIKILRQVESSNESDEFESLVIHGDARGTWKEKNNCGDGAAILAEDHA